MFSSFCLQKEPLMFFTKFLNKRIDLDFKKSETPEPFKLRFVTPFITICTRKSGRRGKSQDFDGIVQLVEQWNHNP